jgi:hypothetical protein
MQGLRGLSKRLHASRVIATVIVILLIAVAVFGLVAVQAAPQQPFPYNHAIHIQKGIACIYCHSGAPFSQSAGLPTRAKCLGCHDNIKADTPALKQFDEYAKTHPEFEWVPVTIMPDFVYFSHQPHISAGVDCKTCHGDLSKMTTAEPQKNINMGWCLNCHKKTASDRFGKLFDCATCHK